MGSDKPVVYLDSGVGGLPYAQWVMDRLPGESYVYVADTANFPYGDKEPDALVGIVTRLVEGLIGTFYPKTFVVACNTASVAALAELRRRFRCRFVGVVPAVKPATKNSRRGRIGLLATDRTVADTYTDMLIREFASDQTVVSIGDGTIVDFVERRFLTATGSERKQAIVDAVGKLRQSRIDALVIGCTHFVYLEDDLAEALGGEVAIIDSREGVGRQTMRIIEEEGLSSRTVGDRLLFITSTESCNERYRKFAERFGFAFHGQFQPGTGNGAIRNQ